MTLCAARSCGVLALSAKPLPDVRIRAQQKIPAHMLFFPRLKNARRFCSLRAQGFSDDAYGTEGAKLAKQKRHRSGLMKFLGECSNGRLCQPACCIDGPTVAANR